ncbi:RNA polymerase sigma-70 factor [Rhabdobacter roseus]|uniref:RNA polymerase sigma-70 factor (ECF subfamily) n=1 Tax=Rhabdobacter roseus TaxID=1655419 RepID=A0A840TNU7_9BACT|nr:sigma-70 family RNA polymerase sigma factor [Rhabdobacter roseus]MBB5282883.1 RNA polymerase sigma-70 factor (ECF subfamily) [Rhabdobacter roseus]
MKNGAGGESEQALLEALKEGSREAFTVIYEKYWYDLYLTAFRRLKKKEVAEELVQDVFVKLWENRQVLHVQQLENYLFRAIKYSVIDYIRAELVQNRYLDYHKAFVSLQDTQTEETVAYHNLQLLLEQGLITLPPKSQEIFRLSRMESWSTHKIALHFSLSDKAVEYHLTRSLKVLRLYLKELVVSLLWLLQA